MQLTSCGDLRPIELHGPSCFESWEASYTVLKIAFIMLAVPLGKLEQYHSMLREFVARLIAVLAQNSWTARGASLRSSAPGIFQNNLSHPFDHKCPWDAVWSDVCANTSWGAPRTFRSLCFKAPREHARSSSMMCATLCVCRFPGRVMQRRWTRQSLVLLINVPAVSESAMAPSHVLRTGVRTWQLSPQGVATRANR
eukprot:3032147-Amphidinium_carterae.1